MPSDDDLWARLSALRGGPSKLPLDPTISAPTPESVAAAAQAAIDEDEELERIANSLPPEPQDEDDDVAALLASLGAAAVPTGVVAGDDDTAAPHRSISALEREATAALRDAHASGFLDAPDHAPPAELRNAAAKNSSSLDHGPAVEDFETEDEILARALAEAAIEDDEEDEVAPAATAESLTRPSAHAPRTAGVSAGLEAGDDDDDDASAAALASLSGLQTLPTLPDLVDDDDEPLDAESKARMDALLGLQGPSLFPATPTRDPKPKDSNTLGPPPRAPGQGWNIPGYDDGRDEDLESWCCEWGVVGPSGKRQADGRSYLQQGRRTPVPRVRRRPILPRVLGRGARRRPGQGAGAQCRAVYVVA